jgi:penicillin-insensitive murein endopeptidase
MLRLSLLLAASLSAQQEASFGDAAAALRWARAGAATMPSVTPPRRKAAPKRKAAQNPWGGVETPSRGPAESIGSHAAGCVGGAEALPHSGVGYEAMRVKRRRFYGHPRLVSYIKDLGVAAAAAGLDTLLVGDLGQPRGGPTTTGHASHQSGLDVDVWFRMLPRGGSPSDEERETLPAPKMVVPDFERLADGWDPNVVEALRLAASDAAVERIFVNPVVKKAACDKHAGSPWLGKLRPWWGHDDHFHVRLSCAPGDEGCRTSGDAIPDGDGCGAALDYWFTRERKAEARRRRLEPPKPRELPTLPKRCAAVLSSS